MGYTLVAVCDTKEFAYVKEILSESKDQKYNKIPYGRRCDRQLANEVLPYHMTVFHWGKEYDERYLTALEHYRFKAFTITVTGVNVMLAEEESLLLYLSIMPGEGYKAFAKELEEIIRGRISSFHHITLAVSKNHKNINDLYQRIYKKVSFPFNIHVKKLELYHIWNPVELYAVFS